MWSDYFFYLMGLPEIERRNQILIMIGFWSILLLIGLLVEIIKKEN